MTPTSPTHATPIACLLTILALGMVTLASLTAATPTIDPSSAQCPTLGSTGVSHCENWVRDWTGPDEFKMFPTDTDLQGEGSPLVEAGYVIRDDPFSQAGAIARNTTTGDIVWERGALDPYTFAIEKVLDVQTAPATQQVYVGGTTLSQEGGFLFALDLNNGMIDWLRLSAETARDVETGGEGDIFVAGERTIDGQLTDAVWALDPQTGEQTWSIETDGYTTDLTLLPGGPLVAAVARNHLIAIDPGDGSQRWSTNLTPADGTRTTVLELDSSPDGSRLATIEAASCNPDAGAPATHVLDAETGKISWHHRGDCVDRGTVAGPVFTEDGERVVVAVAYVPTRSGPASKIPSLNVTGFDVATGDIDWSNDQPVREGREVLAGDAALSPDGDRVYVSGTLVSQGPLDGRNPAWWVYPVARAMSCSVADDLRPIPREGLLRGREEMIGCHRGIEYRSLAFGFDAGTGERLGKLAHEGPAEARGSHMEVDPASGDVLVTGFAKDLGHETRFRTVNWPAEAWESPEREPSPPMGPPVLN